MPPAKLLDLSAASGYSLKVMSTRTKVIIFTILGVLVFVPYTTRISDPIVFRFVRTSNAPIDGLRVYQSWECLGSLMGKGDEARATDENGTVRFPARHGYGSVASRILGRLFSIIAVHASNSANLHAEFTLNAPDKAVFTPPTFKQHEPFVTSGSYLDSVGRNYFPQLDEGRQRVCITWNFVYAADPITITVD